MDYSLEHHAKFIGRPASKLPTPSLVISLPIVKRNIAALHGDIEQLGIGFRPHIKTLKTLEVTKLMLGNGKYRGIVASTLSEIRGVLPLARDGLLEECLYGLPICRGYLAPLAELRKSLRILLMVDNEQQITALEKFGAEQPWDIFIKLDVGSHRAGVAPASLALQRLVKRTEASSAVKLFGFYCHAGHSYNGRSREDAETMLNVEIRSVLEAATLVSSDRNIVVSIGATPTAHVVSSLKNSVPAHVKLELHAGNFPCNDLQQVSTSVIKESDQAVRIAAEVCGVYPDRNEALVNAGAISLSRETSGFAGFGRVVNKTGWGVQRLSQEHGIIASLNEDGKVEQDFYVGQRVYLHCNHVCITAAAFYVFYIVDEEDVVIDAWLPFKGW